MTATGVDYAWGRPGGAALQAAGVQFAMRYVSNDATKNLTRDEYADLLAHGIAVGVVWESTAGRALDGYGAGRDDAIKARTQATAAGLPTDRPIYVAVDFDVQPGAQLDAVLEYFRGWGAVIPVSRIGVYGGFRAVDTVRANVLAQYGWQTTAWSGGRWSAQAGLRQTGGTVTIGGVSCDRNTAIGDTGIWGPPAPATHPWPGRNLVVGSVGDDVLQWSEQMWRRGWRITPGRTYTAAFRTICIAFQKDSTAHGWPLDADGIAGRLTWRATFERPVS